MLRDHEIFPSMSRPGNPYDNATCESFIKTLKREEISANDYEDLEDLLKSVGAFIERYYNCQRLHSALGYRTPAEFENELGSGPARELSRSTEPQMCQSETVSTRGSPEVLTQRGVPEVW